MAKINLEIVTLEKIVFTDEVDSVTLPTKNGEITVLPGHLPIVSALDAGELWGRKDKEGYAMAISGGFLEFADNKMTVLADDAAHTAEIDEKEIEQARRQAEDTLKAKEASPEDVITARRALEFSRARSIAVRRKKTRSFRVESES